MRYIICLLALVTSATLARPGQTLAAQAAGPLKVARAATVTLMIDGPDGQSAGGGSGFIIESGGLVVTAAHVIDRAVRIRLRLPSGQTLEVLGILHVDDEVDLAILKVDARNLPVVPLGDSDSLEIGQRVIAIGSPLGLEQSVSDGLLSSAREVAGRRLLQISAPVSPGSSGGPVLTQDGHVVAVVVSGIRGGGAENLNFALPINYVREIVPFVIGRTPRAPGHVPSGASRARTTIGGIDRRAVAESVNASVAVNWLALVGVETYVEERLSKEMRANATVRYSQSISPDGVPVVERHETIEYKSFDVFGRSRDIGRDQSRTIVHVGSLSRVEVLHQRTALVPTEVGGSYRFMIQDSTVTVAATHGQQRIGFTEWAPRGSIPHILTSAAVAALPDSLPAAFYLWVLAHDSSRVTLEPWRFEIGAAMQMDVPLAVPGESCGPKARTRRQKMVVRPFSVTVGPTTHSYHLLDSRPHVTIGPDTKCVRLPSKLLPDHSRGT